MLPTFKAVGRPLASAPRELDLLVLDEPAEGHGPATPSDPCPCCSAERGRATIQQLEHSLEQLRRQELRRFQHQNISAAATGLLEEATKSLMQKYVRLTVAQLETARQRHEVEQLVAMLTALFGLEEQP